MRKFRNQETAEIDLSIFNESFVVKTDITENIGSSPLKQPTPILDRNTYKISTHHGHGFHQ